MKFYKEKLAKLMLAVTLIFSFSLTASNGYAEEQELVVNNLNQVLRDDIGTTAYLNYQTEAVKSSSVPQPKTVIYYYQDGESFDKGHNGKTAAATTANSRVGYHKAVVEGLKPQTLYHYRVVDENTGAVSKEYSFETKGAVTNFSFVAAADGNYRSTSSYQNYFGVTLSTAVNKFPESAFIMHTGKANSTLTDEKHWNGYFGLAQNTFDQYPLVPNTISKGSANKLFQLNYNLTGVSNDTSNYSFVYGDALFLNVNSQLTGTKDIENHISWLKKEVATKGQSKWIIVSVGNSIYGSSSTVSSANKKLAAAFDEAGVNLVIQGNDDAYIRSYPISKSVVLSDYPGSTEIAHKDGVIYLSPGASGAEQKNGATGREWIKTASNYSSSTVKKAADYKMYSNIQVTAEKIEVTAYTVNGQVVDQFEINRKDTPERESRQLIPLGVNNGFGSDSKTTRSITWQSDATLNSAAIEVVEAGQEFTAENTMEFTGTSTKNKSILTKYNVNKVQLIGLTPGTKYEYRLRNYYTNPKTGSVTTYYSDVFSFKTENQKAEPFTFIHLADSQSSLDGYAPYFGNTLNKALGMYPEAPFIIHTGDMVETPNEANFTSFFNAAGNTFASTAFLPVLGNHEGSSSSNEVFYQNTFSVDNVNGFPLNYSYVYGNALFFNLNSNHDSDKELDKQIEWMKKEVAEKGQDKFIVVAFHKSPYGGKWTSSSSGSLSSKNIKKKLVPVMEDLGVNLVLSGHDHNYIRSYPIKNSVPNKTISDHGNISTSEDGTIYMVSRNSGKKTYTMESRKDWTDVLWGPNVKDITGKENYPENTVFSAVEVTDSALKVTVRTAGYEVIDEYTITK
ncbi:fibronectin type III domain-containing protein [Enterococcus sp. LJL128]